MNRKTKSKKLKRERRPILRSHFRRPYLQVDLPDLGGGIDLIPDNIRAVQAVYFVAMMEEMKVFQVVEKLVELFEQGVLPVGRAQGAALLQRYFQKRDLRFSEQQRKALYVRTFGLADASDATPNREFNDLWIRFLSAVAAYAQHKARRKLRPILRSGQVAKAARDLAANLSLHGLGMAYFVAVELKREVEDALAILLEPEIKQAYGASSPWQVIEQVSTRELGGAANTVRYRTLAETGHTIIGWLASQAARKPPVHAGADPDDQDLINACEQWLAVSGTNDSKVEQYSQPS